MMTTNIVNTTEQLLSDAIEAINSFDPPAAQKCLRLWDSSIGTPYTTRLSDQSVEQLRQKLLFTSFSFLSDEDAQYVCRELFVEFALSGKELLDPMEKIQIRYLMSGYGSYDKQREKLRSGILQNQQMILGKSVAEWVNNFEDYSRRNEQNTLQNFLLTDSDLANASDSDRKVLQTMLSLYDELIIDPVISKYDLIELIKKGPDSETSVGPYASQAANVAYQAGRTTSQGQGKGVLHLPLLKALSEYPRLGEQQLTTEKIRVKSSPELVRPNLANWIRYYRDELGIGFHDQVTRGKFLFQSENGKKLGNEERERISLVLKSLEEELPLDIDTDRMMIVFPVATPPMMPQGRGLQDRPQPGSRTMTQPSKLSFPAPPQAAPARPVKPFVPSPQPVQPETSIPKTAFFGAKFGAAKNVAGETLHFSTGHVLPGEKSVTPPADLPMSQPSVVAAPGFQSAGISQSRGAALPRSPYSIRPLRMREDPAEREMESR